jgi:hypothetical protein
MDRIINSLRHRTDSPNLLLQQVLQQDLLLIKETTLILDQSTDLGEWALTNNSLTLVDKLMKFVTQ